MRRMSITISGADSGRGAHLRQHFAHCCDCAGHAALAELAHAADTERFPRRELAGIQDVAVRLDGVVEGLEGVVRTVGRVEGYDDRRLNRRGQETLQSEFCHAVDQRAAVMRVAGTARGEPALFEILRDRRIERRHHMRRRREAPLRGFLQVDPLVIQVHRQRVAVALAVFERVAAHNGEAHPGWSLEAFPRGGYDRIERRGARVNLERAERTHRIHDQALAMTGDDLRNLVQRVEDAGAGFTVHQRHVRDRGIGGEHALDVTGGNLRVLRVIDGRQLAAEHPAYSGDALAVRAVLRDQHVSRTRYQRADRGLDRERATALHGYALVRASAVHDLQQTFADTRGDFVEVDIPGAPVAQHALLGAQRGRQGSGGQQIRFAGHRIAHSGFDRVTVPRRAAAALATVTDQCVAQRVFERTQPRLVVPPQIESLTIDRLAHLLGTRGSDAALGLVELNAGRLERQFAVVEDPADAALQIPDHVLVVHAQDPPGQDFLPVRHDLEVGSVVSGDVVDAVAELLATVKELLEVAEAAGHRLAACVDDFRVRQHQVDQPDVR